MPTPRDEQFAEAVIEQGLASKEAVRASLAEMKRAESIGASVRLDAVLVKKGLISRQRAAAVLKSLDRARMPKVIGGFELIEEIGRGGMGTVYKAMQVSMNRIVALKVLLPRLAKDKSYIERFVKEARAVAKLSHPHIIQGYDVGEASGYHYFAMEYVDGEPLSARLARKGKIGEAEALTITEQVARALAHAQSAANIIHRDIKPDNIMITKDGVAKLADLGLAKTVGEADGFSAGTPLYISPEQAKGKDDVDVRSDIYSLGATLFHIVTGAPPFTGRTAKELISRHLNDELPSPRGLNPALSVGICRLISIMMAKAREERHQTAEELLRDLRLVREGRPPKQALKLGASGGGSKRAASLAVKSASQSTTIVIVFMLAIMAGIAVLVVLNTGKDGRPSSSNEDDGGQSAASKAYAQAREFETNRPYAIGKSIDKYSKVATDYPDTSWGEKAKARAQTLLKEREKKAEVAFLDLKGKADKLADGGRYTDAVKLFNDYPSRLRFGRWVKLVAKEINKHERRRKGRIRQLEQKAEGLARKGQYDEAIEAARESLVLGADAERVGALIAVYQERKQQWQRRQDQKEAARQQREFDDLLLVVSKLGRERAYDAAVEECERRLERLNGSAARQALELKARTETSRKIWDRAVNALRESVGGAVEIRARGILLRGTLRKVGKETFTVETTVAMITKKLVYIDAGEVQSQAGVIGSDRLTTLRRAEFFMAAGAH